MKTQTKIINWITRKLGIGKCIHCGKLTRENQRFADDGEQDENGNCYPTTTYPDYCHEECFEVVKDRCN